MDIVFENNPRKKIPRETMDKWLNERGIRRDQERKDALASKDDSFSSSIPEKV